MVSRSSSTRREGNFDLVGNNMPVFFIQDAIKFPDLIHAVKPHPDREIPQAQSAHDTFWDFASLHTESTHMLMWVMSDRAIPRSYRTMEGFGVHTFRLVNDDDESVLVKFHWKPAAGVHSLVWEEAQIAAGADPDFHRRDLADAIEAGAFPEWDLGVQVFEDNDDQTFEGIDLLDPTKIVPEELAPVQTIGTMTLNANPTNYFAETEQVAFHTGHLVPGIEVTDDPLLQGRMFSYLDTQLSRLGGPNFTQLPINRPHVGGQRHAARRDAPDGRSPRRRAVPAELARRWRAEGASRRREGAYVHVPEDSTARRSGPTRSRSPTTTARRAVLAEHDRGRAGAHRGGVHRSSSASATSSRSASGCLSSLARVDAELCEQVAAGLGLPAPSGQSPDGDADPSPALSLIVDRARSDRGSHGGRDRRRPPATSLASRKLREALDKQGARAPRHRRGLAARSSKRARTEIVERTFLTTRSIEFDAVVVAGGAGSIERHQGRRPAPGGVPALQGDRRLG